MAKRGENIFKRTDGRWEIRIKDKVCNKIKYLYAKTYAEAKQKKFNYLKELPSSLLEINTTLQSDIRFDELFKIFLLQQKLVIKESTYIHYIILYETYLASILGNLKICDFEYEKNKNIDILKNNLIAKNLKPSSINHILILLKTFLKYAKKLGYYRSNFEFESLKSKRKEVQILNLNERFRLLNAVKNLKNPTQIGVYLSLLTGLRIGEICGLKWKDIDVANQILYVNRTLTRIKDNTSFKTKTKIVLLPPKTLTSKRIIPLPQVISNKLTNLNRDKSYLKDEYFILTGSLSPCEPRLLLFNFKKLIKELSIKDCSFHCLRHTFATNCMEKGFEIKSLSEILGHANVKTTMDLYVHPTIDNKRKQMEKLFIEEENF